MIIYLKVRDLDDGIKVLWHSGGREFQAYPVNHRQLESSSRKLRSKLSELLALYPLECENGVKRLGLLRAIAGYGREIRAELFREFQPSRSSAADVEKWLAELREFTLVVNTDPNISVPWGLVFDPVDGAALEKRSEQDLLAQFWATKHEVVTLYSGLLPPGYVPSALEKKCQIAVLNRELADPALAFLEAEERSKVLDALSRPAGLCFNFETVKTRFLQAFEHQIVLSFFVHSDGKDLILAEDDVITVADFKRTFHRPSAKSGTILVVLNACQSSVGDLDEGFLEATSMPGFCGFLGTEATLVTGDNGLGKSFLLEIAWWALTGMWAERPAYPNLKARKTAEIIYAIAGEQTQPQCHRTIFDWKTLTWPTPSKRPTMPGLIVYAKVDGSFAVWDPARRAIPPVNEKGAVFSGHEVWDGNGREIEGLIRDWVKWQIAGSQEFETLRAVLAKLSPPDLGELRPGSRVRIPGDPRDIPTVVHPYGETPLVYASAGVRRIVAIAYLIVWAWHEHVVLSSMISAQPQRRMVVLIDELEAHLHPRWQRSLLPSLIQVDRLLRSDLKAQYIVATHSPLVMASSEPIFDPESDKLFHLDLDPISAKVSLNEIEYVKFGDVSSWLTSPVFELRHARSNEGESAIEAAKALQLSDKITSEDVARVTDDLKRYLSQTDRFWPRWIAFAERYGVEI